MKQYDDFKEMLEDEFKTIAKKGDITPTELHSAYEITSILKNIAKIKHMEKEEQEGYSQTGNYSRDMRMPYMGSYDDMSRDGHSNEHSPINKYTGGVSNDGRQGRDTDSDGRYSEDNSYRRGRDARGRFTSRDNYSRDNYSRDVEKDRMIQELERMMNEATTEKERQAIRECLIQLGG